MGTNPRNGISMSQSRNPFPRDAGSMCNTLVKEILHARTWDDTRNVIDAIRSIRRHEKLLTSEWEHLNPDPSIGGME